MEISRIDPTLLRALLADTTTLSDAFVVGQHLTGQVLQALADNRFLLAFGNRRVIADAKLPLSPGQDISVEVMKTGDSIELRLEQQLLQQPASQKGGESYGLAALLNAISSRGLRTPTPDVVGLLRALAAMTEAGNPALQPQLADALARLAQPVFPLGDRETIVAALRVWLQNSGVLFESHLWSALTGTPPLPAEQALAALQDDLKVLLGKLSTAIATSESQGGQAAAQLAGPANEALAGSLLAQQVAFAYRWITEGAASFEVPIQLPGEEARARVFVHRDRDAEGTPGQAAPVSISVLVPSETLGPIEANARWQAGTLDGVFFVERDSTRTVLLGGLDGLAMKLGALFKSVSLDVCVDVARVHRAGGSAIEPRPLPGGSVVNIRV